MQTERPDLHPVLGAVLLMVATGALYSSALWIGYYSDDYQWLGRMSATLERPGFVFSIIYRDFNPVLHASFVVDWLLGGASSTVFHAHSILIHCLNTGLLFLLCRRLGSSAVLAAAATLLWAWNVRISEAVIWPAARGHALATLFVLAGLVVLLSRARWREWIALGAFLLALLTKETALMPILLVPLFTGKRLRSRPFYASLGALVALYVVFNLWCKPSFDVSPASGEFLMLKIPFVLLRPLGLGDYYDFSLAMGIAVPLVFLGAGWLLRRTVAVQGLVWVAVCALPVIPLDKLSSRYLYMMALGYALVLCGAARWVAEKIRGAALRRTVLAAVALGTLVVSLANVLHVQREIDDYADLARPYAACLAALTPELRDLAPGEKIVVVDLGARDAIQRLAAEVNGRSTITKLIPYRPTGVNGLITLPDLINVAKHRSPGWLGYAVPLSSPGPTRYVVFDGTTARRVRPIPRERLPEGRFFVARWGSALGFFDEPSVPRWRTAESR